MNRLQALKYFDKAIAQGTPVGTIARAIAVDQMVDYRAVMKMLETERRGRFPPPLAMVPPQLPAAQAASPSPDAPSALFAAASAALTAATARLDAATAALNRQTDATAALLRTLESLHAAMQDGPTGTDNRLDAILTRLDRLLPRPTPVASPQAAPPPPAPIQSAPAPVPHTAPTPAPALPPAAAAPPEPLPVPAPTPAPVPVPVPVRVPAPVATTPKPPMTRGRPVLVASRATPVAPTAASPAPTPTAPRAATTVLANVPAIRPAHATGPNLVQNRAALPRLSGPGLSVEEQRFARFGAGGAAATRPMPTFVLDIGDLALTDDEKRFAYPAESGRKPLDSFLQLKLDATPANADGTLIAEPQACLLLSMIEWLQARHPSGAISTTEFKPSPAARELAKKFGHLLDSRLDALTHIGVFVRRATKADAKPAKKPAKGDAGAETETGTLLCQDFVDRFNSKAGRAALLEWCTDYRAYRRKIAQRKLAGDHRTGPARAAIPAPAAQP